MSEKLGGRLENKVALITGGAQGIGHATADRFLEAGAQVLVGDVQEPESFENGEPEYVELDVSDEAAWEAAVDHIREKFGQLDVLFNNAGIISYDPIDDISVETWERDLSVNLTGVMLGMKHVLPLMQEQESGSVINSSSIWGNVGVPGAASYHATKGAVRNMTKNAAVTYADDSVRINSLHPGIINTPLVEQQDKETNEFAVSMTPMGRMAEPREVANGVLFLASDEASFMTGSELVIDGGYLAQ